MAQRILMNEFKSLQCEPWVNIELNNDDIFNWNIALIVLNPESLFYGGYFKATMTFPPNYPFSPPGFKFNTPIFHPNIYVDGRLCISILHSPGEDEMSGESAAERWSPAQRVESVLISILSLLDDPEVSSPANVDAGIVLRRDPEKYKRIVAGDVEKSKEDIPEDFIMPTQEAAERQAQERARQKAVIDDEEFWVDSDVDGDEDDDMFGGSDSEDGLGENDDRDTASDEDEADYSGKSPDVEGRNNPHQPKNIFLSEALISKSVVFKSHPSFSSYYGRTGISPPMASPSSSIPGYTHEDAFDEGFLTVSPLHTIYYAQYGKQDGKPVLYLHGGPGGHTSKANTTYFDPAVYRVVLLDQRGAGKSTPNSETRENTTAHILSDIEVLRTHIGVSKWHALFGGSWGSTLALLYAQAHPDLVGSLIIQGIFTVRQEELDWEWRSTGAVARMFPESYRDFITHLPEGERQDPYPAYYRLLTTGERESRVAAARVWNEFDISIGSIVPNRQNLENMRADDDASLAHAVLECHYFIHGAWLEEGQILKKCNLDRIRHIPGNYLYKRRSSMGDTILSALLRPPMTCIARGLNPASIGFQTPGIQLLNPERGAN
ncbi:hypothetical protein FQN51_000028 [Onygenales sp. PD_10]|nr:hypothetical protein FQN51_000028 [Onygenales sp. PD_10]